MTSLQWYLFGAWTVMGIVLAYEIINARIKSRRERVMLENWRKIVGLDIIRGESNADLRERIQRVIRMETP